MCFDFFRDIKLRTVPNETFKYSITTFLEQKYLSTSHPCLRSAHTERQRQRPIQSQWKCQPKRQAAPLKFAACRSVWVSP